MNDLEMIKQFAELEGVKFEVVNNKVFLHHSIHGDLYFISDKEYNTISDLALNCAARDKYQVEVDYNDNEVAIYGEGLREFIPNSRARYDTIENLPRAVIECILKSEGKWK